MKTLNFMNVKEEDILTRDEMRNVMAGSGGSSCQGELHCLVCYTPGGVEAWYRTSEPADRTAACNAIYPAYGGSGVTGIWGYCQGDSIHCS